MKKGANEKLLPLTAISPIDGRYWKISYSLSEYFSEYALMKFRIEIEIKYLVFLSQIKIAPKITTSETKKLLSIIEHFSLKDGLQIKKIETKTKHDVKATEYFIQNKLPLTISKKLLPWIHFALTSDDVNNLSHRLAVKKSLSQIIIPSLVRVVRELTKISKKYRSIPMIARTHGQPAVPTTFGKEMSVFCNRIQKQISFLNNLKLYGKFSGAVGNWNAHQVAFPEKNWIKLSNKFLKHFGLEQNVFTTQIAPPEDLVEIFQVLSRINAIFLDFNQDMWRYISDNWVVQKGKEKDVGSSTMPQKINPIEFENSEGNLVIANGILETFSRKLPISRLQRDLSDSTVLRNIGVSFAHCLIAYESILKGLVTLDLNKIEIRHQLNKNWAVLAEALQTMLRKNGDARSYEKIASQAKNKIWTKEVWLQIVDSMNLPNEDKEILIKLTPEKYVGLAKSLIN